MMLNMRMMSMSDLLDDGIKTMVFIGCIVDDTFRAIWLDKGIRSLYLIAMS